MFELCYPDSVTVVRHREPRLWHLATRRVFIDEAAAVSGSVKSYSEAFTFPELRPEEAPVQGIPKVRRKLSSQQSLLHASGEASLCLILC